MILITRNNFLFVLKLSRNKFSKQKKKSTNSVFGFSWIKDYLKFSKCAWICMVVNKETKNSEFYYNDQSSQYRCLILFKNSKKHKLIVKLRIIQLKNKLSNIWNLPSMSLCLWNATMKINSYSDTAMLYQNAFLNVI